MNKITIKQSCKLCKSNLEGGGDQLQKEQLVKRALCNSLLLLIPTSLYVSELDILPSSPASPRLPPLLSYVLFPSSTAQLSLYLPPLLLCSLHQLGTECLMRLIIFWKSIGKQWFPLQVIQYGFHTFIRDAVLQKSRTVWWASVQQLYRRGL